MGRRPPESSCGSVRKPNTRSGEKYGCHESWMGDAYEQVVAGDRSHSQEDQWSYAGLFQRIACEWGDQLSDGPFLHALPRSSRLWTPRAARSDDVRYRIGRGAWTQRGDLPVLL